MGGNDLRRCGIRIHRELNLLCFFGYESTLAPKNIFKPYVGTRMIEASGLTRYYNDYPAILDLNFTLKDNTIVAFLGQNGAGKSTILKMIGGILPPSKGKITIDGHDIWSNKNIQKSKIGYLSEEPALYREMRVFDFLTWHAEIHGLGKKNIAQRVEEVVKICSLEEKKHISISNLSHGFRKRVGIAQAIIHKPSVIILDEPFSGLDPIQIREMRGLLKTLKENAILLISSHLLSEISLVCDQIILIKNGKILANGREEEISTQESMQYQVYFSAMENLNSDAIEEILNGISCVQSFHPLKEDDIGYHLRLTEDSPALIIKTLVLRDLPISRFEKVNEDLSRVFTELMESP